MKSRDINYYAAYAWLVVAINLAVILWGAYVRATGSGAGCGSHWPLCDGVVIPRPEKVETLIEFIHRITSGIALLSVSGLLIWSFLKYPKRHSIRIGIGFGMLFMVLEALIGAGLVLLELVGENDSVARAITGSIHLGNTFFLLASLSLVAWWSSFGRPYHLEIKTSNFWLSCLALMGTLILGMSGAVAALGDTLYPSETLLEGFRQDFSSTAHFLIRLRTLHPVIAVIVSGYLFLFTGLIISRKEGVLYRRIGRLLMSIIGLQLIAGIVNVYLLAPIWMQLVHLLLADLLWISLVLFTFNILSVEPTREEFIPKKPEAILREA